MKIVIRQLSSTRFNILKLAQPGICPALDCYLEFSNGDWTLDVFNANSGEEDLIDSREIGFIEGADMPNWNDVMAYLEEMSEIPS